MSETLNVDADGRHVLRIERWLAHPPAKVWRALTEPDQLSQWFPVSATSIDLRVGGTIRIDVGSDPNLPSDSSDEMRITEVDPPRLFEFRWDDDVLRWELRPDGAGCVLILLHTFDDRAGAASFAAGWTMCLNAMEQAMEGRPIEVAPPSADLHDAYVEAFGLDAGTVENAAEGWRVRFERQLTVPAKLAWAALAASPPDVGTLAPPGFTVDDITAGPVTSVQPPELLEYEWLSDGRPAGTVRWEIRDDAGTGHGARLTLTQTGPAGLSGERDAALDTWPRRIRELAQRMR
ncbi:MAG TPA: SRPBCC family protein [Jiangellaceae bacterium]